MAPVKKRKENMKILRYPDSAMQSAIEAVREGSFKIREAARHFGVPHSTLINKLKGRVPEHRKMGRDSYLTESEEKLLVAYIIANAKKGIPLKRHTLVDTVKRIIDEDKRKTPFKNNCPGRKWIDLFLKRHPQIKERCAEAISSSRAHVTETDLRGWFDSVKEYLRSENSLDILEDPTRIFNADESGFQTCPESGRVLGPVGMKNFFEVKSGKEKEQLTVMACLNAAGIIVSPMIVYPLKRISRDIANNVPLNWSIGKSNKGWMTGPLYFEYIANIFDPWLKKNNITKPVLLLIDGHRSHLTLQVAEYCKLNQILVHALFPNSTHITQPADVSLFKCLKSGWQNIVYEYKRKSGNRHITRAGFAPLLFKVFEEKVTPEIVSNGFKRCGLYPFDPSAVDYTKCMDHEVRKVAPSLGTGTGVEMILLLESFMRKGRTEQFRQANDVWEGDESAKELFYVWKKIRQHCLSSITSPPIQEGSSCTREATPVNTEYELPNISPSLLQPSESVLVSRRTSAAFSETEMIAIDHSKDIGIFRSENEFIREASISTPIPEAGNSSIDAAPKDIEADILLPPIDFQTSPSTSVNRHSSAFTPEAEISSKEQVGITVSTSKNKLIELMAEKQKLISPAFGNHILWPSDSPIKKKVKERIPLAVTSKYFIDYFEKKEEEKQKKLEEIENRKRKREEKEKKKNKSKVKEPMILSVSNNSEKMKKYKGQDKIINKKKTRIIQSDSESDNEVIDSIQINKENENRNLEEIEPELDSEDEVLSVLSTKKAGILKGNYVIIKYEGEYFPGLVENIDKDMFEISTMTFSVANTFKWPEKIDKIWYRREDVIEIINEPVLSNKRGFYIVKEMQKYLPFTV